MSPREPAAIRQLRDLADQAAADPTIGTSGSRISRLHETVALLARAANDLTPDQLAGLAALLHPDTIGHPDQPHTFLGRACAGHYRTKSQPGLLTPATQRKLMDGLADLNRAAGHPTYWWQTRGARPWSQHTKQPLTPIGHHALRTALAEPATHPRWEPFRLRAAALVELLWATGATPEGLAATNLDDLTRGNTRIRVTINPPGRTAPTIRTATLDTHARAALRAWIPLRNHVAHQHLTTPDAPANRALFVTLHPTTADQPDGSTKLVPPGVRITREGLLLSYATWARKANARHRGEPGWPVPTTLQQLTRGGAANVQRLAQEAGAE